MQFPDKIPTEQRPYSVAILNGLPPGILIQSAVVDITVKSGPGTNPNGMKVGPAVVNTDTVVLKNGRFRMAPGTVVSQKLSGGSSGTLYQVRYTLTMSDTDVVVKDVLLLVI